MAFGDIIQRNAGGSGDSITLASPVASGNSLLLFGRWWSSGGGYPTTVSDNVNGGSYTEAYKANDATTDEKQTSLFFLPGSLSGFPIISLDVNPVYWILFEVEGAVQYEGIGATDFEGTSVSTLTTPSDSIPANSFSVASVSLAAASRGLSPNAPWLFEEDSISLKVYRRTDSTAVTDNLQGSISGGTSDYAVGWASFTEATTIPITRKSSTFDIETTLGTITTATLNGVNVFDHVTGQVGTTVSFAGAATDEITTSGEYSLVLGDGATTETITIQVNVVGLPVYNLNKDGADLASLADVEVIVMTGVAGSRAISQNTASRTTKAAGNTTAYEVTDLALTVDQNVFVVVSSAASGVGVAFTDTLELI